MRKNLASARRFEPAGALTTDQVAFVSRKLADFLKGEFHEIL